eukprot:g10169.t1
MSVEATSPPTLWQNASLQCSAAAGSSTCEEGWKAVSILAGKNITAEKSSAAGSVLDGFESDAMMKAPVVEEVAEVGALLRLPFADAVLPIAVLEVEVDVSVLLVVAVVDVLEVVVVVDASVLVVLVVVGVDDVSVIVVVVDVLDELVLVDVTVLVVDVEFEVVDVVLLFCAPGDASGGLGIVELEVALADCVALSG